MIHEEINNVIQNFDQRVEEMMMKQEKDFLSAYRGHMLKVQKELETLKKKCNEQEFLLKRDNRIN